MRRTQGMQRGFSMIELVFVVAIIGILATIGYGGYKNYAVSARVAEGLVMAAAAKTAVAETYQSVGQVPDQATVGYITPKTGIVDSITIANDGSGTITIIYTPSAESIVLTLTPNLASGIPIRWACVVDAASNNKYVPALCRI